MNYEQTIKYTYNDLGLLARGQAMVLYSDNSTYLIEDFQSSLEDGGYTTPTYEELLMFLTGEGVSHDSQHSIVGVLEHHYYADTWDTTSLFINKDLDFLMYSSDTSGINVNSADMVDATDDAYLVRNEISNYPTYNYNSGFTSFSYAHYTNSVTNGYKYVYDYSSLKDNQYTSDDFDFIVMRGYNMSYSYSYLTFSYNRVVTDGLYLSFGKPVHDLYQNGFTKGYNDGYTAGWIQGNENGYQTGVNSGGINQGTATAFTFVGQAFNAVGGIMSLEVLPNVTLGLCFSIPLVIVLIMTIFKLVRK